MSSNKSPEESSDCFFCGSVVFPVSREIKQETPLFTEEEKYVGLNLFCGILCSTDNFHPIRDALIGAKSCETCDIQLRNLTTSFKLMEQGKDTVAETAGTLLNNMKGHFLKLKDQCVLGKVTGMRKGVMKALSFILKGIWETGSNDGSVENIRASVFKKVADMEEESQKIPRVSQKDEGVEAGDNQARKDTLLMPPPKIKTCVESVLSVSALMRYYARSDKDEGGDKDHMDFDKDDNYEAWNDTFFTPPPKSNASAYPVSIPIRDVNISSRQKGGDKDSMDVNNGEKDDSDEEDLSNHRENSQDSDYGDCVSSLSDLCLPSEMEESLKGFTKRETLQCPICLKFLASRGSLLIHISLDHPQKERNKPDDEDVPQSDEKARESQQIETGEKEEEEVGDSQTTEFSELSSQEDSVCVGGAAVDKEPEESVVLTTEKPVKKVNTGIPKVKQFQCRSCFKSFSVRGKLLLHLSVTHSQGKRHKSQDEDKTGEEENVVAPVATATS